MSLPSLLAPSYVNVNDSETDQHSHSLSSMDKLKPTIIIITLILSITVLLSISICLLLHHINRRCLRHLSPTSTADSRRVSPENPPTSSSSVFLDSLPLFTYSSVTRRSTSSAGDNGGDCAVCLSKFEPQDQLRLLPLCCHAFHADCIDTWLQSNLTCPLCRSKIKASESDLQGSRVNDSFRLEIGCVSRRRQAVVDQIEGRSYSIGSFDYVVDEESGITRSQTYRRSVSEKEEVVDEFAGVTDEGAGTRWVKEYVDRLSYSLSSRTLCFSGSIGQNDMGDTVEYDMECNQHQDGEGMSELFRWFLGV